MIDDFAHLLTPNEMMALLKSREGAETLGRYIWRARSAYATQTALELLVDAGCLPELPSPEIMQRVCAAIYHRNYDCSIWDVMSYAKSVAEGMATTDLDCAGNA